MNEQLLYLINRAWTPEWLDTPMAAASSWDVWWPLFIIIGILVAIFDGFRGRAFLICLGLSIGVVDGLVVNTVKDLVGKPRPHQVESDIRTLDLKKAVPRVLALAMPLKEEMSKPKKGNIRGGSFPSGHAANNFAIATVLALFYRWGWIYVLPACFVAYSRVYVGSHYPSDVVISAFLGVVFSLLTVLAANAIWKRWSGKPFKAVKDRHPSLIGALRPGLDHTQPELIK